MKSDGHPAGLEACPENTKGKKMRLRHAALIIWMALLCPSLCGCNQDEDKSPVAPAYPTYETSCGTVTEIDDYPLYTLDYSSDYKFDEYLSTGRFPDLGSNSSSDGDFQCTCFSAFGGDKRFLGRNYDWPSPSTCYIVFTDPPNAYASVSTVDLSFFSYSHDEPPDFEGNQNTLRGLPYNPFDGMNEMGVAIGMNALDEARGPADPSKVTIGELQLIRLVLDYAGSTQEAIELAQQYNIRMEEPPIHYLIADSSGHSVIIEFVNREMEVIHNTDPWQVTTNFVITGLDDPLDAPCWRYQLAHESLSGKNGVLSDGAAMSILGNVSMASTRWSTVYDLRRGRLQVAMAREYDYLHYFVVPR
jgi:choloylglycine hydrolase